MITREQICVALEKALGDVRWFPGDAVDPGGVRLLAASDHNMGADTVTEAVFEVRTQGHNLRCFIPLYVTARLAPDARVLATLQDGRYVCDALHLPRYARHLAGLTVPDHHARDVRVFGGEQSNTSLIVDDAIMVKVLRIVYPGDHPEVRAGRALARAQTTVAPTLRGSLTREWVEGTDTVRVVVAIATVFVRGSRSLWDVACESAAANRPFVDLAHAWGRATAVMHQALAAHITSHGDPVSAHDLAERARAAARSLCVLTDERERIMRYADALDALPGALCEQAHAIHGDYHLGQVLVDDDGELRIIDFEGEPLRSVTERLAPSSGWQDVAGALRSLDYAAHHDGTRDPARAQWLRDAIGAFLRGYDQPPAPSILAAFTVDKALYEVDYELRHRPGWVWLATAGLARALDHCERYLMTSPESHAGVPDHTAPPVPDAGDITKLLAGSHWSAHSILGAHPTAGGVVVRVIRPDACAVTVVTGDGEFPMLRVHDSLWHVLLPIDTIPAYRIRAHYPDGVEHLSDDAYRHLPTVGELDLHLVSEGRHERLWECLGAHAHTITDELGEITGTRFAVWAPSAQAVQVRGDFTSWGGAQTMMRSLGESGVWELFCPQAHPGQAYKFTLLTADGRWVDRADPMARWAEVPPATASRIEHSTYQWTDEQWMRDRGTTQGTHAPMSIYEVHLGSWRPGLSYVDAASQLADYVADHGFTHVEFMPLAEHPFGGSWGYQVTGYYAPTSRFGTPDELRHLINTLHERGIGVIMDWVPAHFPKDEWALARFDGTPLYEHPDPRRGEHPDWGTYIFDFGRPQVRGFLVANALYWLREFHIDGLRVDAVASMLYLDYSREHDQWFPNEHGGRENLDAIRLLKEVNAVCYREASGIVMIAEESTAWPGVTAPTDSGGLGFGFKWNMGWMHDTLSYISREPVHRTHHHNDMTFSLVYSFSENYVLPISHDEVVHGKGTLASRVPGDHWQQMATCRAYLGCMWAHPGKQLLFMGQEFAQKDEWSESLGLDWAALGDDLHAGVARTVKELNRIYRTTPALYERDHDEQGFQWIVGNDAQGNVLAFIRRAFDGTELVAVTNFAAVPHHGYELALPRAGRWDEILNTDAAEFGGSGVGNAGLMWAEGENAPDDNPYALTARAHITVPPLATLYFRKA